MSNRILPSVMHDDEIPNKIFRNNWQTQNLQGRVKLITEIINRHYGSDKYYALFP